jgi:predicted ATPase
MATVPEEVTVEAETHRKPPFLRRVRIRNYKSIKFCDVTLEPLTVLVGRNGSGKSNFVDALAFLRDVVTWDTTKAVEMHGGPTIMHGLAREPVAIEIEFMTRPLPTSTWNYETFRYSVEVSGVRERPHMSLETLEGETGRHQILDDRGNLQGVIRQTAVLPTFPDQALSLPIKMIRDYNFDPREMRQPRRGVATWLSRTGANLANVLFQLERVNQDGSAYRRINQYLTTVVDDVESVDAIRVAEHDAIQFHLSGANEPLSLFAASMSDGTLRVLATLVAAYQSDLQFGHPGSPSLVAIEEPETSLHPAAMHALVDALDEATGRTQILLTTHSTELLDNPTIRPENVRVVEMANGETVITPVDEASVEIVRQHLDTLGGLERQNQLSLNLDDQERQRKLAVGSDAK